MTIPFRAIVDAVCRVAGLPPEDVLGRCRRRELVSARCAIVLIAHQHTILSLPDIARTMGRASHSSIARRLAWAERAVRSDPAFRAVVESADAIARDSAHLYRRRERIPPLHEVLAQEVAA